MSPAVKPLKSLKILLFELKLLIFLMIGIGGTLATFILPAGKVDLHLTLTQTI